VGVYIFLGAHLWPVVSDVLSDISSNPVEAVGTMVEMASPISTNASPTSSPSSLSEALTRATQTGGQVGLQTFASASRSAVPSFGEDALHFQVRIAGDSQLLVKLPMMALSRKKRSSLSVVVERNNHTISTEARELFDGVFSVQLRPEDAYGGVVVHLSMSRPQLSENLTVSFVDRPIRPRSIFKAMFDMVEQYVQDARHAVPTSFQHIRPDSIIENIAGKLKMFTPSWTRNGEHNWFNHSDSTWLQAVTNSLSQWHLPAGSDLLQADIVEWAEDGFRQGQCLLSQMSKRLSNSRLAVSKFLGSVRLPELEPTLNTTRMVAKVATAQERAQQILANAAATLRSRKP